MILPTMNKKPFNYLFYKMKNQNKLFCFLDCFLSSKFVVIVGPVKSDALNWLPSLSRIFIPRIRIEMAPTAVSKRCCNTFCKLKMWKKQSKKEEEH